MAAMTRDEILKHFGFPAGSTVTAERDEMTTAEDPNQAGLRVPTATGNREWDVRTPAGQNATIVVKPAPTSQVTDPGVSPTAPLFDPIKGPKENIPTATTATPSAEPEYLVERLPDGSLVKRAYRYDPAAKGYVREPSLPDQPVAQTAASQTPSDPSQWKPLTVGGRVVALLDPKTGERQTVSADASAATPTLVHTDDGGYASWDGKTLKVVVPGTKKVPQENDTRPNVTSDGKWTIQEKFLGGQWVEDPTIPRQARDPNMPWVGKQQVVIKEGYQVTEMYDGTGWKTVQVGAKAIPGDRTTLSSAQTGGRVITQFDPDTNTFISVPSPGFEPKTQADVAYLVGQLKTSADAKAKQLRDKIGQNGYTAEQAAADFDTWWAENVESRKGELQTVQSQAAAEEGRKEAEAARLNLTSAQAAGQQAANIAAEERKNMVGPGYGAAQNAIMRAFQTGKGIQGDIDWASASTYRAPTLSSIAQRATADYLKHISPTAAGIAGGGGGMMQRDINADLNRTTYVFNIGTGAGSNQGQGQQGQTETYYQPSLPAFSQNPEEATGFLFNSPLSPLNQANMPSQGAFPGQGQDLNQFFGNYVQPMARGGVVTRPTMALLGEQGPEAVVPLRRTVVTPQSQVDLAQADPDSVMSLRDPYQDPLGGAAIAGYREAIRGMPNYVPPERRMIRTPGEVIDEADRQGLTGLDRDLFIFGYTHPGNLRQSV